MKIFQVLMAIENDARNALPCIVLLSSGAGNQIILAMCKMLLRGGAKVIQKSIRRTPVKCTQIILRGIGNIPSSTGKIILVKSESMTSSTGKIILGGKRGHEF